jgi:CRP-like cAMP-binding protein
MASNFADLVADFEPLGLVSDFANEFADAVQDQSTFAEFDPEETRLLCDYLDCFGVPRDTTVLREGDFGDFLAILITGRAIVYKSHEGIKVEVHHLKPGEMIGEMSLIDGQKRFASCVTTEPSDLAILSLDNFNRMLREEPRLANKFMLMLLRLSVTRLRRATTYMLPGLMDESA